MSDRRYTYLAGEDILLFKRRYTAFQKKIYCALAGSWMAGFLLMLFTLTACVGEELQKPLLGEGEGYLTLQIGAISAEVTSSTLTKATIQTPDRDSLTINIKQGDTSVSGFPKKYAELPDLLVLKAGVTYTVEASYGTNNALQETPYFYGNQEVTIQANTNNPVTVTATLKNAMIIPDISSIKNHYEDGWTLTASTSTKTMPLTFINGTCTFYAKAKETVALNFKGTNKAGQSADATWISINNVEACKAYTVQCNPNLTAFENIQVTATAKHTYDNGYLTGTDVELNSNLMKANKEAIKEWNVAIEYNGQIIRTYKGNDAPNITMERIEDWPYIPQSSELSASVTLKSGDVIAVSSTFAVPEPKFEVKVSGDTSCSVYDRSGATEANKKDGSSIFDITSSVSISQTILDNYTELLSPVTYSVDEDSTKAALGTLAKLDSLSWAEHQLTASVTFDNTTKTSNAYPCHVTGLPYTLEHPANEGEHPWYVIQSSGVKFKNDCIHLEGTTARKNPKVGSAEFHIPRNNLQFKLSGEYYVKSNTVAYDFYIKLLNKNTNIIDSESIFTDTKKTGTYPISSETGIFTMDKCVIVCEYEYRNATIYVEVSKLKIEYR